jgi:hypothetical protein
VINIALRFRPFPVWNSEAELRWLEDKASEGLRLIKSFNPLYIFARAEPESVRFCHGFTRVRFGDRDEYLQLYADAGWQYVSSWVGWHYFKSSVATASDIDRVTVATNNARFLKFMAWFYLIAVVVMVLFYGRMWIKDAWPVGDILRSGGIGIGVMLLCYLGLQWSAKRQLANAEKIRITEAKQSMPSDLL